MKDLVNYDKSSLSQQPLSHENKRYVNHLEEILIACNYLLDLLNPKKKHFYKKLIYYLAFYHDIFKLTKEFQDYLVEKDKNLKINHAELAGILLYANRDVLLKDLDKNYQDIIISICYSHHTFPKKVDLTFKDINQYKILLPNFITEIKSFLNNIVFVDSELENLKKKFLTSNLSTQISTIESILEKSSSEYNIENYLDFLYLYSIFTISDRVSASFDGKGNFIEYLKNIIEMILSIKEINIKNLEEYLNNLPKDSEIDALRNEAREEILKNFEENREGKIYVIELPTGLGKTLTSLSVAIRMRNDNRPIIYSLPFLSIIEQTERLLSSIYKDEVSSLHHLSPLESFESYQSSQNYEEELKKEWNEFVENYLLPYKIKSITITTHERLRRTFFPNSRNDIILFSFLVGGIWIIDEIQLYPLGELYPLCKVLEEASRLFDMKIIIMSATIPTLKFEKIKPIELVKNKNKYVLNRYKIDDECLKRKYTYENVYEEILELLRDGKSVGIMVNTVRESIKIYNHFLNIFLKDQKLQNNEWKSQKDELILKILKNEKIYKEIKEILNENANLDPRKLIVKIPINQKEVIMIFLNGKIPSLYKRRILEILEKLKNEKKQLLIISTQSLEAGVDIDLDIIFREIDTIDSIVQTAGRVNRNNKKPYGKIILLFPSSKSIDSYFVLVRGFKYRWLEDFFRKLDDEGIRMKEEKDVNEVVKKWYDFLIENIVSKDKNELLKSIKRFEFEKIRKIYAQKTEEYLIEEGERINEILEDKKRNKPKDYKERIIFYKQFSINSRILMLYKIEIFSSEKDIIKDIEALLDGEQ